MAVGKGVRPAVDGGVKYWPDGEAKGDGHATGVLAAVVVVSGEAVGWTETRLDCGGDGLIGIGLLKTELRLAWREVIACSADGSPGGASEERLVYVVVKLLECAALESFSGAGRLPDRGGGPGVAGGDSEIGSMLELLVKPGCCGTSACSCGGAGHKDSEVGLSELSKEVSLSVVSSGAGRA